MFDDGMTIIDVTGGADDVAVTFDPASKDDDDHGRNTLTHDRASKSHTLTVPSSEPLASRIDVLPPTPLTPWLVKEDSKLNGSSKARQFIAFV
jgi:hypothetical protein